MDLQTVGLVAFVIFIVAVLVIALVRRDAMLRAGVALGPFQGTFSIGPAEKTAALKHGRRAARRKGLPLEQGETFLSGVNELRPLRVLWVDDNPDFNIDEVLMLRDIGHNMVQTTKTETAMVYLNLARFDLVITDLTRDGDPRAGFALLRELGGRWPVIVYAADIAERKDDALRLGAKAVTNTPKALLSAVLELSAPGAAVEAEQHQ